jgi:hypothetical protein
LRYLLGRNARRIERDGKKLPTLARALDLEVDRQLSAPEICGDTRQRLVMSSALLGHLAPHGRPSSGDRGWRVHSGDRRRHDLGRTHIGCGRLATQHHQYEQREVNEPHQRTKT